MVQKKLKSKKPVKKAAEKPTGKIRARVGYTVHVREHYRRPRD